MTKEEKINKVVDFRSQQEVLLKKISKIDKLGEPIRKSTISKRYVRRLSYVIGVHLIQVQIKTIMAIPYIKPQPIPKTNK